jgi:hypothetical protein
MDWTPLLILLEAPLDQDRASGQAEKCQRIIDAMERARERLWRPIRSYRKEHGNQDTDLPFSQPTKTNPRSRGCDTP